MPIPSSNMQAETECFPTTEEVELFNKSVSITNSVSVRLIWSLHVERAKRALCTNIVVVKIYFYFTRLSVK